MFVTHTHPALLAAQRHPRTIPDVLEATSYDRDAGRKMLVRMKMAGELVSPARGLYTTAHHHCLLHFSNDPPPVPNVSSVPSVPTPQSPELAHSPQSDVPPVPAIRATDPTTSTISTVPSVTNPAHSTSEVEQHIDTSPESLESAPKGNGTS